MYGRPKLDLLRGRLFGAPQDARFSAPTFATVVLDVDYSFKAVLFSRRNTLRDDGPLDAIGSLVFAPLICVEQLTMTDEPFVALSSDTEGAVLTCD
jgi:hypothetical protein